MRMTAIINLKIQPIFTIKGYLDLGITTAFLNVKYSKLNLKLSLQIQVNLQCFYSC